MSLDSENSDFECDTEEIDEKQHEQLIKNIVNLNKNQHVSKPSRTEPFAEVSEYNLINKTSSKDGTIDVDDLTKTFKSQKKLASIGKKLKKVSNQAQTLAKPLEKPQAERIRRKFGYGKTREELAKWDAVVTAHRGAEHLRFPLNTDLKLKVHERPELKFRVKTELEKALDAIKPKEEVYDLSLEEKRVPLTMKELVEKRKEMAKLRAHMSFIEAKAKRQNKIKSKKYHRIQRREKIKKQLEEFELLQKTNPELALKKLEEIEKARAEERVSLRHKSTGKWARNKQIRAKYDQESRKVLAQQLSINKELTQKVQLEESSESEDEKEGVKASSSSTNNPWLKSKKTENEVDEFLSGYRKFWEKQNQSNESKKVENVNLVSSSTPPKNFSSIESLGDDEIENLDTDFKESSVIKEILKHRGEIQDNLSDENEAMDSIVKESHKEEVSNSANELSQQSENVKTIIKKLNERKRSKSPVKSRNNSVTENVNKQNINGVTKLNNKNKIDKQKEKHKPKSNLKQSRKEVDATLSEWNVTRIDDEIDKVFNNHEKKLAQRLKRRHAKIAKELSEIDNKQPNKAPVRKQKKLVDLSLNKEVKRPVIDEELLINDDNDVETNDFDKLVNTLHKKDSITKSPKNMEENLPRVVKIVDLNTKLPDLLATDDNEDDILQQEAIAGAFEDEDVVEEFNKEKQEDIEKDTPKDIDLTLPGWGSWGGKDSPLLKRKRKRFIIKMPKKFPRKDENRGDVIIYENGNKGIKDHLVSELPFPFQRVKDFEASIRAPIGNTFVPETAFRKLILPPISTKLGTIIEPLNEDILLKKKYSSEK